MNSRHPRAALVALTLLAATALASCDDGENGSGEPDSSETLLVEHDLGTAEIPADPQRVFVMPSGAIELAISLDLEMVGSPMWGGIEEFPEHISSHLPEEFSTAGTDAEPSFEDIAALEPDLIVGDDRIAEHLERLEGIAPVVGFDREDANGRVDWRFQLSRLAEILELEERANAVLADAEQRVAEVDATIPDNGETIAALRVRPEEVRFYTTTSSLSSGVLQNLEHITLADPDAGDLHEAGLWATFSSENLLDITTDWLYLVPDSPADLEALRSTGVWDRLPAVQAGQVCVAEDLGTWILNGPLATQIIADEVEACLGEAGSAE
ncbi:ABC transporter substrate-binding protein [Bogoriella caseilytica]|uniref:Iron complex transport system substrate-binding protein n=1 Tax=Bogoriella caseilytica TaxID=56055 RepID=A0A3N2BDU2_9MICO|nr:ABC transporter substrate-binding protein [Bogoriella caseilytica]ROR73419.1 iron complex transport system substrate-binding protein [Bogoriella caseilytica]